MRAGLGVDQHRVAAGLDVERSQLVGLHHHEVGLEVQVHQRPACRHHVGSEGEVGHEHPVHDVPVDPMGARLGNGLALLAQA